MQEHRRVTSIFPGPYKEIQLIIMVPSLECINAIIKDDKT